MSWKNADQASSYVLKKKSKDYLLRMQIQSITKFSIKKLILYKQALQGSLSGYKLSYERMEFLGDAVIALVVAAYVFAKYPKQAEGFLTDMRTRIVNRDILNETAKKMGLVKLIHLSPGAQQEEIKHAYGSALEALVGAIYLDQGYLICEQFVKKEMLLRHIDIEKILTGYVNYKGKIMEWAQKQGKKIQFKMIPDPELTPSHDFTIALVLDDQILSQSKARNKKKAEQQAAQLACDMLNIF